MSDQAPASGNDAPTARLLPMDVPTVERHTAMMGTDVQIIVVDGQAAAVETAIVAAFTEMRRIEALMSEWQESSLLSAINRAAGSGPVPVTEELLRLLLEARTVSQLSDGAFDVTFAGAGRLWDFKAALPRPPTAAAVAAAVARVDWRKLVLDQAASTAFLSEPGMRVGLGGIAKGYAVDRAVQVLARAGLHHYAVNAGGDLTVRGRKGGRRWTVGIRDPRDSERHIALIPVENAAVVTSGDYERFFVHDGRRYSHILDPRTGWPVAGCRSVTIVAPKTWWADALATAVFVLGPQRGLALIESLPDVEGLIIDGDGNLHPSKNLTRAHGA